MAEVVKMPKLSDTMTEGVVAEWHKEVGDSVESGELLAEIETDKATMEFESFQDGVLLYKGVEAGEAAPVDGVLAILGEKGEDYQALLDEANSGGSNEPEDEAKPTTESSEPSAQEAPKETKPASSTSSPSTNASNGRIKASPLAKKLAEEKGIDLQQVSGTGEGGRIVKRDIDGFTPSASSGVSVGAESFRDEPVSQMRKTISKRLSESKFSAPHFYLTVSIDMDNAIKARNEIKESSDQKVSFNDLVIKASAMALKKHPEVNSSWLGDKIRYNEHVHIGVAVAVPEGLLVPVVRFADAKPLSTINAEVKDYAQKAKDKKLQPQDWEGNTFTISNLGMFGIEEFTAIINPPDACILAVGGISQVPVVKNGAVVPGNIMKVTLSCDHRVVDGAKGAAFLNTLKNFLENPVMMLV